MLRQFKGDLYHDQETKAFHAFAFPVSVVGNFPISTKHKISLNPSLGSFFITNALGRKTREGEGLAVDITRTNFIPYSFESDFSGNQLGFIGELALEFGIFKNVIFHLGYIYSANFSEIYSNKIVYRANDQDYFPVEITSNNNHQAWNLSFYFPVGISN